MIAKSISTLKLLTCVAQYTLIENIRNKIFYIPAVFMSLFMLSSIFIGEIALDEQNRFILNVSMVSIQLISVFMAAVLGVFLFRDELRLGVLRIFLTKPISISQYLLGKFLGGVLTLIVTVIIMLAVSIAIFYFRDMPITALFLINAIMVLFEAMIILSISLFFSQSSSQLMALFSVFGIWIIGHASDYFKLLITEASGLAAMIGHVVYRAVPNFEKMNYKEYVLYNTMPSLTENILTAVYAILFAAFILFITQTLLKRSDIS